MSETTVNTQTTSGEAQAAAPAWDISGIPTTPVAPPGGLPVYPGPDDPAAGIPTTPVAPSGGLPVYPGDQGVNPFPFPVFPFPVPPTITIPGQGTVYYGQVRFLNASTTNVNMDAYIDGQNVFSGSTFATVSTYTQVSDGFHTVTVRRTNGQIYYQQTLAFVAGEKVTLVILDTANGITLAKVSDMGCTNVPSGYGCLRVANMSYQGSNYDVRMFNNQTVFSGLGYKEISSFKQASSGNYTFFVTNAQNSLTSFGELPVILLSSLTGYGCSGCAVNNPILTYSLNIRAGKTYTSYIIGNPWSNMYQVYTLED